MNNIPGINYYAVMVKGLKQIGGDDLKENDYNLEDGLSRNELLQIDTNEDGFVSQKEFTAAMKDAGIDDIDDITEKWENYLKAYDDQLKQENKIVENEFDKSGNLVNYTVKTKDTKQEGFNYLVYSLIGREQIGGNKLVTDKFDLSDGLSNTELKEIDENNDGYISKTEFENAMNKQGITDETAINKQWTQYLGAYEQHMKDENKVVENNFDDNGKMTGYSLNRLFDNADNLQTTKKVINARGTSIYVRYGASTTADEKAKMLTNPNVTGNLEVLVDERSNRVRSIYNDNPAIDISGISYHYSCLNTTKIDQLTINGVTYKGENLSINNDLLTIKDNTGKKIAEITINNDRQITKVALDFDASGKAETELQLDKTGKPQSINLPREKYINSLTEELDSILFNTLTDEDEQFDAANQNLFKTDLNNIGNTADEIKNLYASLSTTTIAAKLKEIDAQIQEKEQKIEEITKKLKEKYPDISKRLDTYTANMKANTPVYQEKEWSTDINNLYYERNAKNIMTELKTLIDKLLSNTLRPTNATTVLNNIIKSFNKAKDRAYWQDTPLSSNDEKEYLQQVINVINKYDIDISNLSEMNWKEKETIKNQNK